VDGIDSSKGYKRLKQKLKQKIGMVDQFNAEARKRGVSEYCVGQQEDVLKSKVIINRCHV